MTLPASSSRVMMRRAVWVVVVLVAGRLGEGSVQAAETADPVPMRQTYLALTLESDKPVITRTQFLDTPPTIILEFPGQRVIGSLPEQSAIQQGVIHAIKTQYSQDAAHPSQRSIQAIHIVLSAPYAYRVRSETRRVVVEIAHPASVVSLSMELGLRGSAGIGAMSKPTVVGDRFRAMQAALNTVAPPPWALQIPTVGGAAGEPVARGGEASDQSQAAGATPSGVAVRNHSVALWVLFVLSAAIGAVGVWVCRGGLEGFVPLSPRPFGSMALIDQLVWRAFERQGWQLVRTSTATHPPGTLRVIANEGGEAAFLCIGNGIFVERHAVEQFIGTMGTAGLTHGFLVATGSFTVPAQRLARLHQVTLVGREQVVELIGIGAASEYVTQQLEQARVRLEEAQEQVRQHTNELEALRRQRNEASWYLGEERATSGKLQAQLEVVSRQLAHHEQGLARWQQEAAALRRQWEESEWYLGEAQSRLQGLERRLAGFQETATRADQLEQERDDAVARFESAEGRRQAIEQKLDELQTALREVTQREQSLQRAFDALNAEFNMVLAYGERRGVPRVHLPAASVEVLDAKQRPLFSGCPENLSSSGIGVETTTELPVGPMRVRLSLPGLTEPMQSTARLVWQKALGEGGRRYRSGCRFVRLPAASRSQLKDLLAQPKA